MEVGIDADGVKGRRGKLVEDRQTIGQVELLSQAGLVVVRWFSVVEGFKDGFLSAPKFNT